jgi:hypothetical protein
MKRRRKKNTVEQKENKWNFAEERRGKQEKKRIK